MNRDALVGLVKGLPTTYGRVAKTKVYVIAAVVIGVGILAAVLTEQASRNAVDGLQDSRLNRHPPTTELEREQHEYQSP